MRSSSSDADGRDHGPGADVPDRHGCLPGGGQRPSSCRSSRHSSREDITRCLREAFHIASTGRPARARGRPKEHASPSAGPRRRTSPATGPRARPGHPLQIQEQGHRDAAQARALRGRRDRQRRRRGGAARAGRDDAVRSVTTLLGQGRFALAADAPHARQQVRELGAQPHRSARSRSARASTIASGAGARFRHQARA